MKNPPRALLAKLFNRNASSALRTLGARHLITPTLSPPGIPANHTGGLNQGHVESGEAPVVVPVYYGIETGQDVVLYLNDNPVDTRVVIDENQSLLTYIPARELPRGDSDNTVHYHAFTGFNGVNEEASYPVSVRVKTTVPGNPPGDPIEPGVNPYLSAPVDVPESISDPNAVTTVPVGVPAYANMAEGDVITVFWGGAGVVAPPLTAAQVGRVVYVEVPQAIIAARPGNNIVVRYHVYDAVRNYSLYSQSAFSNVTPVATLLAPLIAREVNDTLNMDSLAGSDIDIMVMQNNISPTADITLHFTGQPEDWPYLDFSLGPIRFGGAAFYTFTVPNVLGRSLVNSETIVFYEAVTNGTTARSFNAQAQVIGTAIDLPAPKSLDAPGGLLDPDKIIGASFDLTAPANTAFVHDTLVQLVWEGINGAGDIFHHELTQTVTSATAGAAVTFKVQKGWAEEIAGGSVELYYNLIVPGTAPVTYASDMLPLNVAGETTLLPIPEFEPKLTAADELDVDNLTGSFHVKVNVTNAAFVGGALRVHWQGQSAARILEAPVSSTGVIRVSVDRATLIDPNLDQSVDVWYELVRPDGRIGRSGHVLISVISGASQTWPMPEVWDASDKPVNPLNPVKAGTSDANTATVVVRDARLKPGDILAVVWRVEGRDLAFDWANATNGEARAPVPASVLAASLGKTVEVTNVILVGGTSGVASPTLSLRVLPLPESALSAPRFVEAAGTPPALNLDTFTGSATIAVDPWPLIAEGQTFWMYVKGTLDDGKAYSERLAGPYTVQPSEVTSGIRRVLERSLLLRLENASTLGVELKVDLSGTGLESAATLFPEGDAVMATVKLDLPAPVVTGAENGYLDPTTIPADGVTVRVPAYEGRAAGQWVYANFTGQAGSEEATASVQVVDATTPMDFKISKAEVLKNEGQAVTFEYKVARTQGALYSDSKSAPVEIAQGMPITQPIREDFEGFVNVDPTIIRIPGCEIALRNRGNFGLSEAFQQPPFVTGKSIVFTADAAYTGSITYSFESPVRYFRLGVSQDESVIDRIGIRFEGGGSIGFEEPIISGWVQFDSTYYFFRKVAQVTLYVKVSKKLYMDNISYVV
ncbi:hypothetical protein [Pseudomonas sp. PvP001]|uniref:hypothetical protein n=1 Tax=Pseudomonas sp. PvP001 TaxID=3158559 RepID=UPI003390AA8A